MLRAKDNTLLYFHGDFQISSPSDSRAPGLRPFRLRLTHISGVLEAVAC